MYLQDKIPRTYSDAVLIKSPQEMREQVLLYAYQYQRDQQVQQAAVALASSMISANFVYRKKETESRKEEA